MEKKSVDTQIIEIIKEIPGTTGILRTARELEHLGRVVAKKEPALERGVGCWRGGCVPAALCSVTPSYLSTATATA
jgi:hypothetical protein